MVDNLKSRISTRDTIILSTKVIMLFITPLSVNTKYHEGECRPTFALSN